MAGTRTLSIARGKPILTSISTTKTARSGQGVATVRLPVGTAQINDPFDDDVRLRQQIHRRIEGVRGEIDIAIRADGDRSATEYPVRRHGQRIGEWSGRIIGKVDRAIRTIAAGIEGLGSERHYGQAAEQAGHQFGVFRFHAF